MTDNPLREAIARLTEHASEMVVDALTPMLDEPGDALIERLQLTVREQIFRAIDGSALASQSQHIGELERALEPFASNAGMFKQFATLRRRRMGEVVHIPPPKPTPAQRDAARRAGQRLSDWLTAIMQRAAGRAKP